MDDKPKYKIGQKAIVNNWSGQTQPLEILDVRKTYHKRVQEYCWGYKMSGYTGLTMEYVPEGYLIPVK